MFGRFALSRDPKEIEALTSTVMSEAGLHPLPPATASIDSQTGSLVRNVLASLDDAKAEDIVSIDLRGKTTIADVMIIATGRANTHVGAIAERVIKACKDRGLAPRVEGLANCDWVLIDAGDAIVHVFRPEARQFYNLEKMWGGDRPAERSHLRAI
jgi:ribosome-associated protein